MQLAVSNPGDSWSAPRVSFRSKCYKPRREDALLDLVLTSANELITGVNTGGSLGCSEHALAGFVISRNMGVAKSGP